MQSGERQIDLRFHASDLTDPAACGLAREVVQQRGLSDPGLAAEDQRGTRAAADTAELVVEA